MLRGKGLKEKGCGEQHKKGWQKVQGVRIQGSGIRVYGLMVREDFLFPSFCHPGKPEGFIRDLGLQE